MEFVFIFWLVYPAQSLWPSNEWADVNTVCSQVDLVLVAAGNQTGSSHSNGAANDWWGCKHWWICNHSVGERE